ncbi:beta-galactosidase GalA [Pinibacter soli]|uniref:Beta-galactosidase GalA n=1 Tax=Pinibacter soli TaxID=3044211 RepID=A0ABT6R7G2_9BACT|nr:beta-galactosidase GalA [Pinibacter soli]MDI3318373.1 beta-galactosidase GalA [Pinibacter soli]
MQCVRLFVQFVVLVFCCVGVYAQHVSFDSDWKFHLGNAADAAKDFNYSIAKTFDKTGKAKGTCIAPDFKDSNWTSVSLPHDWVVGLPFTFNTNRDVDAHGYKPVGGLYPENSIGWYRKSFTIPAADSGKRISLEFDGIYRDSKIWVNGFYIGANFSGYLGCRFDITDVVKWGGNNVVVVRADASQYEGWFYEGAGIYRHAWLTTQNNLHVQPDGVFIQTAIKDKVAEITATVAIDNKNIAAGQCLVSAYCIDRLGKIVARSAEQQVSISANGSASLQLRSFISAPHLWDIDDPYLYRVITVIKNKGSIVEQTTNRFGIRSIVIDSARGLLLNGKSIKIKGVCCHQDHAGVGSAIPTHLQYYRIGLLKEMGANAYRTSHNAPSPDVLDACDSLGLLVLDETRLLNSSNEYLQQFAQLIRRDLNHPSVLMWSIGNEEEMAQDNSYGKRIAQSMIALQQQIDPTRTCTYGANNGSILTGVNEVIPVRGVNYFLDAIDAYHLKRPSQPVIGTEVGSTVTTRGIYVKDTSSAYVPDHDITYPHWATTAEKWWQWAYGRPWFMGGFVWTGFDYRGEPTPFKWPNISSHFGIMDMCGFPKNNYYYYQAWWSNKDVLQLSPHWNHSGKNGQMIDVWVNSNAAEVELFLNNKSLGEKTMPVNGHLQWSVAYEAGVLKAIGYKKGKQFQTQIETTGVSSQIKIEADQANVSAGDAVIVNVSALDSNGRSVPDADNEISFFIEGDATIIGVGNGDPSSHEPDQIAVGQYKRKLFNGRCQLIIKAGSKGMFQIKAAAANILPANISVQIANKK